MTSVYRTLNHCNATTAAASVQLLQHDNFIRTLLYKQVPTQGSSVAFSHNLSVLGSAALNNSLLFHFAPHQIDLNLHLHDNKTTTTSTHLQMTLPDMSTEGIYDSEFYMMLMAQKVLNLTT